MSKKISAKKAYDQLLQEFGECEGSDLAKQAKDFVDPSFDSFVGNVSAVASIAEWLNAIFSEGNTEQKKDPVVQAVAKRWEELYRKEMESDVKTVVTAIDTYRQQSRQSGDFTTRARVGRTAKIGMGQ